MKLHASKKNYRSSRRRGRQQPSPSLVSPLRNALLVAIALVAANLVMQLSRRGSLYDIQSLASEASWMPPMMESSGTDTSKSRQLMKYYESYRYVKAASRYDYIKYPAAECGKGPDFEEFFKLPQTVRSRFLEDSIIFKQFFLNSGITGPLNGTVVELGAFDGATESNSHFFEKCLGWKTLLIEGNPENYQKVLSNRPFADKMSFAPSCDAEYERVNKTVQFYRYPMTNVGLPGYSKTYETKPTVDVPCGPLSPVLEDVFEGRPIQFFSLDVEGAEMLVLDTIDFQKVQVNVWMIEVENDHCKRLQDCEVRKQVREKMASLGYKRYSKLVRASDVYVHPSSPFQIPESAARPE